jgi:hypothetical protein
MIGWLASSALERTWKEKAVAWFDEQSQCVAGWAIKTTKNTSSNSRLSGWDMNLGPPIANRVSFIRRQNVARSLQTTYLFANCGHSKQEYDFSV